MHLIYLFHTLKDYLIKTIRESKYVGYQMNEFDALLEEVIYAFQENNVVDIVGEICNIKKVEPDAHLYAGGISLMKKHSFLVGYFFPSVSCLSWRGAAAAGALAVRAGVLAAGLIAGLSAALAGGVASADEAAAEMLAGADVIILGEIHDNPQHHQVQADLINRLQPRAVIWEMITPAQAAALTPQILQSAERTAQVLNWEASGWPDFSLYAPVFKAAAQAAHRCSRKPRKATAK